MRFAEKDVILPRILARQFDQARQNARHLHDGEMPHAFRPFCAHFQLHDDVERFVEQLRKRMRGIDGQRRQHRPDLLPDNNSPASARSALPRSFM